MDEGKESGFKIDGRRGIGNGGGARNLKDWGRGEELERMGEEEGVFQGMVEGEGLPRARREKSAPRESIERKTQSMGLESMNVGLFRRDMGGKETD